jgi:hypothetical protein
MEFLRNGLIIALLFILNSSIEVMLYGYLIATYTTLIISSIQLQRHINYNVMEQTAHILPSLILAIVMGTTVSTIEDKLIMSDTMQLILQLGIGGFTYIALAWGLRLEIMNDVIEMITKKLKTK